MYTKLDFDYFGNSDARPLVWGSRDGKFLCSVGLEDYWQDKYEEHLRKSGEKHDIQNLLSYLHENGRGACTGRVITPKKAHEIAFIGSKFTDLYLNPKEKTNSYADAIERNFKEQRYDVKLSRNYKNNETAFGKALYIKDSLKKQKNRG